MPKDSILMELSDIFRQLEQQGQTKDELVTRVYQQVKRILVVATDYGFDKNLWHNYLTFLLITNENPFSLTCEKVGANDGSVNYFALLCFEMKKPSVFRRRLFCFADCFLSEIDDPDCGKVVT